MFLNMHTHIEIDHRQSSQHPKKRNMKIISHTAAVNIALTLERKAYQILWMDKIQYGSLRKVNRKRNT